MANEPEEKKTPPDTLPPIFNPVGGRLSPEKLAAMREEIEQAVIGQPDVIDDLLKTMSKKRPTSIAIVGTPGIGKTEAIKEFAKQMLEEQKLKKGSIIMLDEVHQMDRDAMQDALDAALGRPTRREIGDQAAQSCRDGVAAGAVIPMKPLQIRRGFSFVM